MTKSIFTRHELKYLISYDEYVQLVNSIRPFVSADKFGGEDGKYSISSIYFDSDDYSIYYETRNKALFRQKLRLRVYNDAKQSEVAFIEVKQKYKKVVNKRRTQLLLKNVPTFLQNQYDDDLATSFPEAHAQTLKEIQHFRSIYQLEPKVWVRYERHAFQGIEDSDLRITFDSNLTCRTETLDIEATDDAIPFIDQNIIIMEVKVDQSVPFWLTKVLSEFQCQRGSLSKYCESVEKLSFINKPIGAIAK